MDDVFQKTNNIVVNSINTGSFSLNNLEMQIISSGAPMRLSPGVTVKAYIDDLCEEGILCFNKKTNTFFLDNLSNSNNYVLFRLPELM